MMVELNLRTDGSQNPAALQLLRQMRDWFIYALQNAGVADEDTGTLIMPCILIYNGASSTNIVARPVTEEDNAIVENYFPPAAPETLIHRYQILFRLEWYEMR